VSGLLVLVTGTGRSGTSTISGSLHHLGLHVPGPYLGANKTNPKGFYESRWAVDFHKELTGRALIDAFDGQPDAMQRARSAAGPDMRSALADWLRVQADGHTQVVVKDPRSVWAQGLWRDAAHEAELDIAYVSMLRHPAEVIGSRATYYASKADEAQRRRYEVCSVGRWVNGSLISERETRGQRRTFVPYTDLLDDWRTVLRRVRDDLGLELNTDLSQNSHHPVDDFIDPNLRRIRVTWEELIVPPDLRGIAQSVWDELSGLYGLGADDEGTSSRLDELSGRYETLYADAAAIALDAAATQVKEARLRVERELRDQRPRKDDAAERKPAHEPSSEERRIRDASGRELLRAVGRRLVTRIRKR